MPKIVEMRECPGCSYLLPPEWDRCGRCETDLTDVAPRAFAAVGAVARATTFAASRLAPLPELKPLTTRRSTSLPFEPSAPVDLRGGNAQMTSGGWMSIQRRSIRTRLPIVGLLILSLIAGAIWFAWQRATVREIPADLVGYVEHGEGVEHVSRAGGYSVLLPFTAEHDSRRVTVSGAALDSSFAYSRSGDHVIGVAWFDVPSRIMDSNDVNENLVEIANGYAATEAATITELDFGTMRGFRGLEANLRSGTTHTKIRIALVGARVYVLHAGGTADGAIGFGRLTESFDLEAD